MIAKDIKPGTLVVFQGEPCLVKSMTVQSPSARGAATLYKYRTTNLRTRQKVDITLKGGESLDVADDGHLGVLFVDLVGVEEVFERQSGAEGGRRAAAGEHHRRRPEMALLADGLGQFPRQVRIGQRQRVHGVRRMREIEVAAADPHLQVERRPRPGVEQLFYFLSQFGAEIRGGLGRHGC